MPKFPILGALLVVLVYGRGSSSIDCNICESRAIICKINCVKDWSGQCQDECDKILQRCKKLDRAYNSEKCSKPSNEKQITKSKSILKEYETAIGFVNNSEKGDKNYQSRKENILKTTGLNHLNKPLKNNQQRYNKIFESITKSKHCLSEKDKCQGDQKITQKIRHKINKDIDGNNVDIRYQIILKPFGFNRKNKTTKYVVKKQRKVHKLKTKSKHSLSKNKNYKDNEKKEKRVDNKVESYNMKSKQKIYSKKGLSKKEKKKNNVKDNYYSRYETGKNYRDKLENDDENDQVNGKMYGEVSSVHNKKENLILKYKPKNKNKVKENGYSRYETGNKYKNKLEDYDENDQINNKMYGEVSSIDNKEEVFILKYKPKNKNKVKENVNSRYETGNNYKNKLENDDENDQVNDKMYGEVSSVDNKEDNYVKQNHSYNFGENLIFYIANLNRSNLTFVLN